MLFPEEQDWEKHHPDNHRCDDFGLAPLLGRCEIGQSAREGEWGEEETKSDNDEKDTNHVALPKEIDKDSPTASLERTAIIIEDAGAFGLSLRVVEYTEKEQRRHCG